MHFFGVDWQMKSENFTDKLIENNLAEEIQT